MINNQLWLFADAILVENKYILRERLCNGNIILTRQLLVKRIEDMFKTTFIERLRPDKESYYGIFDPWWGYSKQFIEAVKEKRGRIEILTVIDNNKKAHIRKWEL